MIGISLLTLVPGISGGSETYARELCRALARVGELRYRVFLPDIAPDAARRAAVDGRHPLPRVADDARPHRGDVARVCCGRGR